MVNTNHQAIQVEIVFLKAVAATTAAIAKKTPPSTASMVPSKPKGVKGKVLFRLCQQSIY